MHRLLLQAALKSTADSDPLFATVSLRWLPEAAAAAGDAPPWHPCRCGGVHVPRPDELDGLCLGLAIDWPLQLLFPPEVSPSCADV